MLRELVTEVRQLLLSAEDALLEVDGEFVGSECFEDDLEMFLVLSRVV